MVLFRVVGALEIQKLAGDCGAGQVLQGAGMTKSKNVSEHPECPSPCPRKNQQAFAGQMTELMNEVMKD